jgi:hypothetical protein
MVGSGVAQGTKMVVIKLLRMWMTNHSSINRSMEK